MGSFRIFYNSGDYDRVPEDYALACQGLCGGRIGAVPVKLSDFAAQLRGGREAIIRKADYDAAGVAMLYDTFSA